MTLIDTAKIGKKGGDARAANLSPKARSASAKAASRARWDAYYKEHPEKLKAKLEKEKKSGRTVKKKSGTRMPK